MREYLEDLVEEDILKIFNQNVKVWQVLVHVVNHGTQHRAQISAVLRIHNVKLIPQNNIFCVMGRI